MKTEIFKVDLDFPELDKIKRCAHIICKGGLVIFPTETVYGIAADYSNPKAMKRLKEVKQRSEDKPFSAIISQKGLISNYTPLQDSRLFKLINEVWPGPLTVVLPSKEEGQTIGVRMPDNIVALKLAQESQCRIAAPSANIQGSPPPNTCQQALAELDGLVEAAIDGGPSKLGVGSSVIDLTKELPALLREGSVSLEALTKIMDRKHVLFVCTGNSCRSVMAEYLLKDKVKGRDDVMVSSAGTSVFLQSTASSETISVLNDEGIDPSGHISQGLNTVHLKSADLIFAMTQAHRQQILERVPSVEKRVYVLREFSNIPADFQGSLDVPDPIGRSNQEYKECLSTIKECINKIVDLL